MYLINACVALCIKVGRKISNCFRGQTESSEEHNGAEGAYVSMNDAGVVKSAKSLSSGYISFEESGAALKLCAFLVSVYMAVGIVAFSFIFESWSIVSSAYFSVVAFTTIGYGDLSPTTQLGRLFQVFYTLFGVTILGIFLGIIGHDIVGAQLSSIESTKSRSHYRLLRMFSSEDDEKTKAPDEVLKQAKEEAGPKEKSVWQEIVQIILLEAPLAIAVFAVCTAIGAIHDWTFIDSIYFCTITMSTVGFGDMHPTTHNVRLFCIFFLPVAVAVFGELLSRIASAYIDRKARKFEQNFLDREFTLTDLEAMDYDADQKVSRGEFISFMLVAMQKVDQESINELNTLFDSLDANGSGALDKEDLVLRTKRRREILKQARSSKINSVKSERLKKT